MGNLFDKWRWGGDPDIPNPVSGLTLRDIHTVHKTWHPVHVNATEYGMELFKRFFMAEPETKTMFKYLEDYTNNQLADSYQFRAHVINFMTNFDMAIKNLSQPEVVIHMMHRLGAAHQRHRVPLKYFPILKDVLLGFLVNDLKLDDAALASWGKFLDFMFPHLFSKMGGDGPSGPSRRN